MWSNGAAVAAAFATLASLHNPNGGCLFKVLLILIGAPYIPRRALFREPLGGRKSGNGRGLFLFVPKHISGAVLFS